MRRKTDIESKYHDREVNLEVYRADALLSIVRCPTATSPREEMFAYITPRGARALIEALEPLAPPMRPPIDVIDVLNEALLP